MRTVYSRFEIKLNPQKEPDATAIGMLGRTDNKSRLIVQALLEYGSRHPEIVGAVAARKARAQQDRLPPQSAMPAEPDGTGEEILRRIDRLEKNILQALSRAAVQAAAPPEEESPSVVKRIERNAKATDEDLRQEAEDIDPLAKQFLMGFG